MKLLLIVGTANDIFIYNMVKWLKKSMNVTIDIFEFYPSEQQNVNKGIYNHVESVNSNIWINKIRGIRSFIYPYYASYKLQQYLKNNKYDIIHCHWIVPPLVLTRKIKQHCKKLFVTFWGREYKNFKLLGSWKIYKNNLDRFIEDVDYIINSRQFGVLIKKMYPKSNFIFKEGYLGAASLDYLYELMSKTTKSESKNYYKMPNEKISVMIGYSGKSLHQHMKIIEELIKYPNLRTRIHLIVPMTRGGGCKYINKVENALLNSGYTYTLLKDSFLTDVEIAKLRYATEITLQLSTTDGFSRSIIECLCAKSIVIYGNWLEYEKHLSMSDLFAVPVSSISEAIVQLEYVIDHKSDYIYQVEQNSINGKKRNKWSDCIKDWVDAYNEVM